MKVLVSARLDGELVRFLEDYQRDHDRASRSEALEDAIQALRDRVLEHEYAEAMDEWIVSEDAASWDRTSGDGLDLDDAR
jgi:Arc/MetJ-type ribon-helix-helix transcriptional regulator